MRSITDDTLEGTGAHAGELGKRLAAGDEAVVEDIQAVIAPLIRGAYERFGEEVILQIMFGMIAPDVFEALWKRRVARTSAGPRGPKALWQ
jgi:hypothetical protein